MATTTTAAQLSQKLFENGQSFSIIGVLVYWNIKDVCITKEKFAQLLGDAGLNTKYAKEHNTRSALTRALNSMKENNLVRMVSEDRVYSTFQFTDEILVGTAEESRLEYKPKYLITVDKEAYGIYDDFKKSIAKVVDPKTNEPPKNVEEVKDHLTVAFEKEKNSFKSSDITRCVQRIFDDYADIVSLRQQGAIYFVPATFTSVVNSVKTFVNSLGGVSRFDAMPLPDVHDARVAVGGSFAEEVSLVIGELEEQIAEQKKGDKDVTEKWVEHRKLIINKLRDRIEMYAELIGEKGSSFNQQLDSILKSMGSRTLVVS